jgi:hypothetical protein
MFEIGGAYENRIGRYTVLDVDEKTMLVQYEDGSTAELNIAIQERIWENIVVDEEVKTSRGRKKSRETRGSKTRYFIKPFTILSPEDMLTTGQLKKVNTSEASITEIKSGDRLMYYALENKTFFAVSTITGPAKKPKGNSPSSDDEPYQFPVDVDIYSPSIDKALPISGIELESHPNIENELIRGRDYLEISEDDFELMGEILAELAEDDSDIDDDIDEDEDFDE